MSKALLHGLPVLILIALIVLVYRRSESQRPVYRLSQPWTHQPILWAAVDEPLPAGQHVDAAATFGGGASGRW
ncbi:MAG: hypothetical protein KIH64_005985 [Mycobacterium sp.]|nr:hypothetical protein [Mycobacterium sp.]